LDSPTGNVIAQWIREMLNVPCAKNHWISWPNDYLTPTAHNHDWSAVFLAYLSTNITCLWCYPMDAYTASRFLLKFSGFHLT
jgi:hypothetical protein